MKNMFICVTAIAGVFVLAGGVAAADVESGGLPSDVRLGSLNTLDGYFPFTQPSSLEDWQARRQQLRKQILVANGLLPLPEKTNAKPVVHHKVDRADYTVYGVILEPVPGYYLTGSLYVPKNPPRDANGKPLKMPGVLSPHGHWANGRFYRCSEKDLENDIASGAEKHNPSGRYPLQAMCATLAQLGCVVFHYDMIGCADSVQLPHHAAVREHMNTKDNWGFCSPQAELHLQSTMGLQTLGSLRALDWFETLPEVDPKRIGITGASGGGTQAFILSAIDDRLAVEFPAVMVSTAMQGGCTCENANYLRIGTGNVEFAAMFAPKPLGMTAANDWTREMATKGFPELKTFYESFYNAGDNVALYPHTQFGHNYNYVSRNDVYGFMIRHLGLTAPKLGEGEMVEKPFEPLTIEEMTVWIGDHPKPSGDNVGDVFERRLLREMSAASQRQLDALHPRDTASLRRYRHVVGEAFKIMIGRDMPKPEDVQSAGAVFHNTKHGESVTAVVHLPQAQATNRRAANNGVTIVVTGHGVSELPRLGERRLTSGDTVVVINLFGQVGQVADDKATLNGAGNDFLAYTYGYNHPMFAKRVHDILTVIAALKKENAGCNVTLVGVNGGAPYAAAARTVAGDSVNNLIVAPEKFRFANVERLDDPLLLPGAVKYGDLPAIIALSSPHQTTLMLAGDENASDYKVVTDAYDAAGEKKALQVLTK